MSNTTETENPTLQEKTLELCQFILEDPTFTAAIGSIEVFKDDEKAQQQYRLWQEKAVELHQQHREGQEPSQGDLEELERLERIVMENQVAADFVGAEDSINAMFSTVMKTVQKTLQKGGIPSAEELKECCGKGGCGSCE